jgi:hypothetical protein
MDRVFILSPARTSGKRAAMVMNPAAQFDLAERVRKDPGAPIGEVFSFLSGLYFRGKLTYARHFGLASEPLECCDVITSRSGLVSATLSVTAATLRNYGEVPIDPADERYAAPLRESADRICELAPTAQVVLLGSIATGKYVDPLLACFRERLLFPEDFIGRGDMSRGGLLLRAVASNSELPYRPVAAATTLKGTRPGKLTPLPRRPIGDRGAPQ